MGKKKYQNTVLSLCAEKKTMYILKLIIKHRLFRFDINERTIEFASIQSSIDSSHSYSFNAVYTYFDNRET